MKKTKIILSVILCITVLVTLCACTRGNGDDTTTTEPPTSAEYKTEIFEEPKQLEEVGLTYNDLVSANSVEALLQKYETITIENGRDEIQLFTYKSRSAFLNHVIYNDDEEYLGGWIDGFGYTLSNEGDYASVNAFDLSEDEAFPYEDYVVDYFGGQELFVKEIGNDYYKIIHTYEGMLENEKFEYIFDKETLELREYNFALFDGTTGSTVVDFNKPLSEKCSEVIEIMDGERKSITVKSELYDFDEVIRDEAVLSIPSEWKLELLAGVEIALYSNEEQTEIYEYPGHGIDHTIYVTNSLG